MKTRWIIIALSFCLIAGIVFVIYKSVSDKAGQKQEMPGEHVHQYESFVEDATCTVEGLSTIKCTICGAVYDEAESVTTAIPALGHLWGDGYILLKTTEDHNGVREYCCGRAGCGEIRREEIPALKEFRSSVPEHTHSFESHYVEPTCEEYGYIVQTCSICGFSYVDIQDGVLEVPLDHFWDSGTITMEPTEEANGIIEFRCQRDGCDETFIGFISAGEGVETQYPAHNHQYEEAFVVPTCTEAGKYLYTCSLCGKSYVDEGPGVLYPALGHAWDEGTIEKAATSMQSGVVVYQCTREDCDAVLREELPVMQPGEEKYPAHIHKYDCSVVAATEESEGYILQECTVCGRTIISHTTPEAIAFDTDDNYTLDVERLVAVSMSWLEDSGETLADYASLTHSPFTISMKSKQDAAETIALKACQDTVCFAWEECPVGMTPVFWVEAYEFNNDHIQLYCFYAYDNI